jgi:hypothetical protein
MRQIVGLRFASNDEFVALAQRAADQGLTTDAIKQAVKQWRADLNRCLAAWRQAPIALASGWYSSKTVSRRVMVRS